MAFLLHHLLSETAGRWPEKEALSFEGATLNYAELETLSNRLAHALRDVGVKRGDRVGIYMHKSLASIVGVFGVLKAGGIYVPLDAHAPPPRTAYVTRNCGIEVLLTASEKLGSLGEILRLGSPLQTLILTDGTDETSRGCLPGDLRLVTWKQVQAYSAGVVSADGRVDTDLAYILYTSGSTGEPKGVMISHRTIFTFINWCHELFKVSSQDRVTSHAPLHFDLSTFDIYVTMKGGGACVLVPESASSLPVRLARLLQDERVTVTYLVPSILSLLVSYGALREHDLSTLRLVLFAGEVFPIKYLRKLVAAIPRAEYYNLYGPTETNVCTYYKVRPEDLAPDRSEPLPIGQACENVEVFAVDDGGSLIAEPGRAGELWVRGSCVAQGYWGDPERTAQRFVTNPYGRDFPEIVYRTGDVVRLAEDGRNWIFMGRRDHMVKSRGHRIELGEIESVLLNHLSVREAAAVAVPDELLGNRIEAFVVPLKGRSLTERELASHCREQLPRYMLPERFLLCEALPRTTTGKIDRSVLTEQRRLSVRRQEAKRT